MLTENLMEQIEGGARLNLFVLNGGCQINGGSDPGIG